MIKKCNIVSQTKLSNVFWIQLLIQSECNNLTMKKILLIVINIYVACAHLGWAPPHFTNIEEVVLKVTTRARARSLTVSAWSPGAVKGVRSDSDLNDVPMLKVVSFSVRVALPLFWYTVQRYFWNKVPMSKSLMFTDLQCQLPCLTSSTFHCTFEETSAAVREGSAETQTSQGQTIYGISRSAIHSHATILVRNYWGFSIYWTLTTPPLICGTIQLRAFHSQWDQEKLCSSQIRITPPLLLISFSLSLLVSRHA